MAKINLLPWREELRKERQQEFLSIIVAVSLAAAALVWFVTGQVESQYKLQKYRNSFIQKEMAVLNEQITEIRALQDKREQLLERMQLIQNLQGNRPIIVRLFDEIARSIPDDLYFTSLDIKGTKVNVKGRAKSNNRVAALMRNFDDSDWFDAPNLISVKAERNGYNTFEVTMVQVDPKNKSKEDE
ncbi:MAG TPA: pilus assembly protein PilN [Oceanospirillales bacterium]|nr:pilus assembly protein PilN [Oleispira sp.]HCM05575.1 pilus assembly protein PilN [Oceanospirillales bacterium]|tara:strand:- start:18 stop:575 length:558 start_codon:yes stop_codon:yes gene_type:complete